MAMLVHQREDLAILWAVSPFRWEWWNMDKHGSYTHVSSYTLFPAFYIPIFELDPSCLNPSGIAMVCNYTLFAC